MWEALTFSEGESVGESVGFSVGSSVGFSDGFGMKERWQEKHEILYYQVASKVVANGDLLWVMDSVSGLRKVDGKYHYEDCLYTTISPTRESQ